jgi:hypothetical protein
MQARPEGAACGLILMTLRKALRASGYRTDASVRGAGRDTSRGGCFPKCQARHPPQTKQPGVDRPGYRPKHDGRT